MECKYTAGLTRGWRERQTVRVSNMSCSRILSNDHRQTDRQTDHRQTTDRPWTLTAQSGVQHVNNLVAACPVCHYMRGNQFLRHTNFDQCNQPTHVTSNDVLPCRPTRFDCSPVLIDSMLNIRITINTWNYKQKGQIIFCVLRMSGPCTGINVHNECWQWILHRGICLSYPSAYIENLNAGKY